MSEKSVELGFVGLGRMGLNMVYNLLDKGVKVSAWNRSPEPRAEAEKAGAEVSDNIKDMIGKLPEGQKIVWLMVPSGKATDDMLDQVSGFLKEGDVIVDGGNSYFEDSQGRYKKMKNLGISFIDCGTSGGIEGARNGACMMAGGDKDAFDVVEKYMEKMCVKDGYGYMGTSGAGHFVKGIHNGVEYGMMGAIAEGLSAIRDKQDEFGTDLDTVAKVYSNGSIVASRLVTWVSKGMKRDYFKDLDGTVPKGETEEEMEKLEKLSPMKVLETARKMRVDTRENPNFMGKLLAVMRNEFGGHKFNKK